MKIIYFPAYFPPEVSSSSYLIRNRVESFSKAGFYVSIYAPSPTRGVSKDIREKYKNVIQESKFENVRIYRFSMMQESESILKRALRYSFCAVKQFYYGIREKNVDCIFVTSTPPIQGLMAGILSSIKRVPFIYNLQDIFPDSLIGSGLAKKKSITWTIGRLIENYTYKKASKIIVISEDFKLNLLEKGVSASKIEIIPNWVDDDVVLPITKLKNPIFDQLGLKRTFFYVVYAGSLGKAQNFQLILDAAEKLQQIEQIKFILFVAEKNITFCKNKVKEKKISSIQIYPLQPYEKVSQVYSMADVSIVSCKKGFGNSAMPSKTWSIMATGTPVLASFDRGTELERIITENDVGLFTESEDIKSFSDSIMFLYQNPNKCKKMGKNAQDYILKNSVKSESLNKYIQVFNKV